MSLPRISKVGALVALVVFIGGSIAITTRDTSYTAEARVLIAPKAGSDAVAASDTLSRGTVVGTFAEYFGAKRTVDAALTKAGIAASDHGSVTISSHQIADASVVLIQAAAPNAAVAESAADAVASATPQLGGYSEAFAVSVLATAQGSAKVNGASSFELWTLLVVIAALLGIVAAIIVRRVAPDTADHQRHRNRDAHRTPASTDGG